MVTWSLRALARTVSCLVAGGALALGAAGLAEAGPAPAGTEIVNAAEARYFDEATGVYEIVRSNQVTVIVAEHAVLNVDGGAALRLSRGAENEQFFFVTNAGNTALDTTFEVTHLADPATVGAGAIYLDANRNGVVDAGETQLGPTDPLHLDIGQEAALIYTFAVSPAARLGDTATLWLDAFPVSDTSGTSVGGVHAASGSVIVTDQALELSKSVSHRQAGGVLELDFALELRNDSEAAVPAYGSIDGEPILVDGRPTSGVLVRDMVPVPTSFRGLDPVAGVAGLVHLRGDPLHSYRTQLPADLGEVDAVAFLVTGDYPVGRSTDMRFRVGLSPTGGLLRVDNIAATFLPDPSGPDEVLSNAVSFLYDNALAAPVLGFVDPAGSGALGHVDPGADVALVLEASGCNTSGASDRVTIRVESRLTGDVETVIGTETGPNTGIFVTGPLPLVSMPVPVSFDGAMATARGDMLVASAVCAGESALASLPVSPGSFVFDSVTNAPVEGARVMLLDGAGAELASAVTDAEGYFGFPAMPAGTYRYGIDAIGGYAFPSVRQGFWGFGRTVDAAISYGSSFAHAGGFLVADVPLDPSLAVPLVLTKTASVRTAAIGSFVSYTLVAENLSNQALVLAQVEDLMPAGMQFVPGSVLVGGAAASDPSTGAGGALVFDLGTIAPASSMEFSYLARVSPSAREGRAVNVATLSGQQAGTGSSLVSAPARATVEIANRGGALSREAAIIGTVFMDCDGDGLRDGPEEPGVPGVRIVTQQGLSVVTDIDGKFSLVGLRPRAHVLSVRENTLPSGTSVSVTRTSDLLAGGTRLVTLKAGQLVSETFALEACTPERLAEVAERVRRFSDRAPSASALRGDLPIAHSPSDRRSARSEAGVATTSQILRDEPGSAQAGPRRAPPLPSPPPSLAETIRGMTPDIAILGLENDMVLSRRVLTIRVKGSSELDLSLNVNGSALPPTRIGEKSVWEAGRVQAIEYVAVRLQAGANEIELIGRDPFGNIRERAAIRVFAPGAPRRLEILAPDSAPARAGTRIPVVVRIADAEGRTSEASGLVTLSARLATWDAPDARPLEPGLQVYVDRGEATFDLIAPQVAGTDRLTAQGSFGRAETTIDFSPDLEERIFVGVIEGAVSLRGSGDLLEPGRISPFEDTTEGLSGELYFKGRIRGDALLTLRYSSDKDTTDRLFQDIRRDEYYPVYGDNSEHGHDAQASGNLFVKVEKGQSYILYGDIAIEPELPAYQLGALSRLTTGAKAKWHGENVRVTVFAAHTRQVQRVAEFAGKGISGPYALDLGGTIEGSERVEVLVRDKDTGSVISTSRLTRYQDYVIDVFADTILFQDPIPQADRDGNPVSVRVTYEVEDSAAPRHLLYGGEVVAELGEGTEAGLRVVNNAAPVGSGDRSHLVAGVIRSQIDAFTTVEAEIARSWSEAGGTGTGVRIGLEREDDTQRLRFEASHTDPGFAPENSAVGPGLHRFSVDYDRELSDMLSFSMGAEFVRDAISGTERIEADILTRRRLDALTDTHLGMRFARDLLAGESSLTILSGSDWRTSEDSRLRFSLDLEGNLRGDAPGVVEIGVEYDVSDWLSISGAAVRETDPQGRFDDNQRLWIGADYDINEWLAGRSEMRLDALGSGSLDGSLTQRLSAATAPSDGLNLRAVFEHNEPLNSDIGRITSLALGADYQSADGRWVSNGDFERAWEDRQTLQYTSFGIAGRINDSWTVLGQTRAARDKVSGEKPHVRHRTRVGAAYRPPEDTRLEMLAWYEQLRESRTGASTREHEWLVHATYEVDEDLRLDGRYSGSRLVTSTGGFGADALTQLVQGGVTFDLLDDRWLLSLNAGRIWDNAGNSRNALGVELGFAFAEGAIVSVGHWTSRGDDLRTGSLHSDGLYLNVRLLLDERLLDRLAGFMDD